MALSNFQLYSMIAVAIVIIVTVVFFMVKQSSPSSVTTTVASQNKDYLPVLSEGEGKKTVNVSSNFKYNPSTNVLTAGTFKGDLDGSAKNIKISSEMLQPPMVQRNQNIPRMVDTGGYRTMNHMDSAIRQGPMPAQGLVGQVPTFSTLDANKRYLTMTNATTGNQELRASNNVWYDTVNNLINVDASGAYNIRGGAANQILYQVGPNNTSFIPLPTGNSTNQYLKWTGIGYEFSPFPEGGAIKAAGTGANQVQFRDSNGNLAASSNFTFNPTSNMLTITGQNNGITAREGTFAGTVTAPTFSGSLTGTASNATRVNITSL